MLPNPCVRAITLPTLALALFTALGCSAISSLLAKPEITLADLELTEVSALETSGVVTLRLLNPNREPLTVDGAAIRLYVNGLRVGTALSNERLELPALGSALQRAELNVSNLALLLRVRSVLEQKAFDYSFKGKVWIVSGPGTRRVSVSSSGRFDFDSAPP